MTRIIVLTSEETDPTGVGVSHAGQLSPREAEIMCMAAARHFREQIIEAEVRARLDAARKQADDDGA